MTAPLKLLLLAAPLCALGLAGCDGPQEREARSGRAAPDTPLNEAPVTDPLGPHAPVRSLAGEPVAVSQVLAPAGPDGIVSGDIESQTGAALRVLAERLEADGLTLADIAQLTVHVVAEPDGSLDAEGVARAWRRSFGNRMQPAAPARTLVGVAALPGGARVSLSALAVRPAPDPAEPETDTP